MTNEELQAEVEKLKNQIRDASRPWRHDRWESIKADPQAAAVSFAVGCVSWQFLGPHALKLIGF